MLLKHYCDQYGRDHGLKTDFLDSATIKAITLQDWPGNVRELKNYIRRLCVYRGTPHEPDANNSKSDPVSLISPTITLKQAVDEAEKKHIVAALSMHNGQITAAYKTLMISRKCLYDKINKYGIDLHSFRDEKNLQI